MELNNTMVQLAVDALEDKKAQELTVLDISNISVMTDYFIIVTAGSHSQMNAMVDGVEEALAMNNYPLQQREGNGQGNWILLDYGDVVVHIFDQEGRSFYDLERIWADGKKIR